MARTVPAAGAMLRRRFIGAALVTWLAAPASVAGQTSPRIWRVGFLAAASRESLAGSYDAFVAGMRELGYVEGRNLVIDARFAEGRYERLPDYAAELVRLQPDVIVALPSPAIRAAQKATVTIPIVFASTGDPVGSGFVQTLARPGGNITGLSNSNLDVADKTLDLLKTIVPKMTVVAVLANPASSTEGAMLRSIDAAAQKIGVRVIPVEARNPDEIEAAFATITRHRADAVVVAADALLGMQRRKIADLAIKHRLPSISQGGNYGRAGGLMGYGLNGTESYRRAAVYVDKILRGAKPADLPVEQPTKLELVINLATAKTLGLTIPQSVLLRADEVIQ